MLLGRVPELEVEAVLEFINLVIKSLKNPPSKHLVFEEPELDRQEPDKLVVGKPGVDKQEIDFDLFVKKGLLHREGSFTNKYYHRSFLGRNKTSSRSLQETYLLSMTLLLGKVDESRAILSTRADLVVVGESLIEEVHKLCDFECI
nr:hypothetical protein [Tanacetum cinerariifolium]